MTRKGCKRVCLFTPDMNEKPTTSLKSGFGTPKPPPPPPPNVGRCRSHKQVAGARGSSSASVRLFRYVRVNVAKALGLLRKKRRGPTSAKCSSNMVAPQRFVPPRDSHHSETLEDCIEFINSSYRKSI